MRLPSENPIFVWPRSVLHRRAGMLLVLGLLLGAMPARAGFLDQVPVFRGALGIESISFTAGSKIEKANLGSLMTMRPTVLWDFPTFSSRMGVHFMSVMGGPFGALPMSGIGFSGYFYPLGVSTGYEIARDETLFQKSKPGPFLMAMFTPLNFNINRAGDEVLGIEELSVAAYMVDFGLGAGYDYPLSQNMILSAEAHFRTAKAQQEQVSGEITYQGFGFSIVFSTSYY